MHTTELYIAHFRGQIKFLVSCNWSLFPIIISVHTPHRITCENTISNINIRLHGIYEKCFVSSIIQFLCMCCLRRQRAGVRRKSEEHENELKKRRLVVWSVFWRLNPWTALSFMPSLTPCYQVASICWMSCLTQSTGSVTC